MAMVLVNGATKEGMCSAASEGARFSTRLAAAELALF